MLKNAIWALKTLEIEFILWSSLDFWASLLWDNPKLLLTFSITRSYSSGIFGGAWEEMQGTICLVPKVT